jgi:hypothetical protein
MARDRLAVSMDQWGKGTAYRCVAADCGSEVTI